MNLYLEKTDRAPLGLRLALLGVILVALMTVVASSAQAAAPTLEPVVSATPSDPNSSSRTNVFTVSVDPAETETITQIQCRRDPTVATAWGYCASPAGGNISYTDLPNGLHEIQIRTFNADGAGPVSDFTWTVATPLPTQPPVINTQPANPNTASLSKFTQNVDPADSPIAAQMQCRLDGAAWSSCGATVNYYPGNGDHTFETRATNAAGPGPIASVDWTVAVPDVLSDAINVDDVADARWDGANANSQLNQLAIGSASSVNGGDVNGDGIDDLMITDNQTYDGSVQIIFGGGKLSGARNMINLGPNRGYRIKTPDAAFASAPQVASIGDQNGDGLTDQLVAANSGPAAYVVYGVSDPSALPSCGGGADRCIDPETMTSAQGYKITVPGSLWNLDKADFDGDGTPDILIGTDGAGYVLKGGVRTGTVDLEAAVGTDALKITVPAGISGGITSGISDVNGDGKDEVSVLGGVFSGGSLYVVTGRSLSGASTPIDTTAFSSSDGFIIATAPLGVPSAVNIGDMNGDSRDDLMVGYINLGAAKAGEVSIIYMPELPATDPVLTGDDLESGNGYVFKPGGVDAGIGLSQSSIGDIDGDGLDDQLLGANATLANGFDGAGSVYLVKGQQPGVDPTQIGLGPEFTSDLGVSIVSGKARNGSFGVPPAALGDIDGDGLPDFALAAAGESNNGISGSGSVYIVPGKNLFARSITGNSTVVDDTKAAVNGQVGTNGRTADYHFEYGTSEDYGSTTDSQSLAAGGAESVSADLSGLDPDTEYHYRLVVTNELGFNRIGEDRTFITEKTPAPQGCDADNTAPGCPGWDRCKDDSTQPGCPDYDYCKANAGKPECQAPKAKLSGLIVSVAQSKVKRGKKTTAKATIVNTGTAAAAGTKVCLTAPKKMIGGAKCVNVGSLGAGASKTVKFKVTVKKKAKKGKKVALKFKASANGLGSKTGKVKIKVG
jgi:hypothetical protein